MAIFQKYLSKIVQNVFQLSSSIWQNIKGGLGTHPYTSITFYLQSTLQCFTIFFVSNNENVCILLLQLKYKCYCEREAMA